MIGLCMDSEASVPTRFINQNKLGWMQSFLGEWSKSIIPAQYGIVGIPEIVVIGPDGKVIATGLRGANIEDTVRRELRQAK